MVTLFADSFRGLQVVPIITATDRKTLEDLLQSFSTGSFPAVFKEGERAFEQKRLAFKPFHGLSQYMNRIATRYSQALSLIRDANKQMHAFCTTELPHTIRTRLNAAAASAGPSEPLTEDRPSQPARHL